MKLGNAKAVITGGASGLGFATAQRVIDAGGQATLLDINEEQGEMVVLKDIDQDALDTGLRQDGTGGAGICL